MTTGDVPITSAFMSLTKLLEGSVPPFGVEPIHLHMGEVKAPLAHPLATTLGRLDDWGRYPPLGGTPQLRTAYQQWLERRFGVGHDSGVAVEPTAGSKQALSILISAAVMTARRGQGSAVRVAIPTPFYPTYESATRVAEATPVYYNPQPAHILSCLSALLHHDGPLPAAVILCHPCSPGGEAYGADVLADVARLVTSRSVQLIVDECYIDSYSGESPTGMLALVATERVTLDHLVVLHTLSKRSAAPGLRSGFVTGAPESVERYARLNRSGGVSSAWPVCEAAAKLWQDDGHVERLRWQLRANWDAADQILGDLPGYSRPAAGFYLWIFVGDDETFAWRAWTEEAVKVMPGRYLGPEGNAANNGTGYIRAALTGESRENTLALLRLKPLLKQFVTHAELRNQVVV